MAYDDFSGGGTLPLVAAWNTGDTGTLHFLEETDNIVSVDASEGSAPFALESTGDSAIYYAAPGDPQSLDKLAGLVGQAKQWFRLGNSQALAIDVSVGHTVIILSRILDRGNVSNLAYSGPGYLYSGYGFGGYVGVRSTDYGAQTLVARASSENPALEVAANVANASEVLALSCGSTSDSGTIYRDKVVIGASQPVNLRGGAIEYFSMMGKSDLNSTTATTDVNVAICALYSRELTLTEISDITDLMRHWEANGSAPNSDTAPVVTSPTPPTRTVVSPAPATFSAEASGSPNPTIQWKACTAADDETNPANWADAETVLGGDVTLPTTSGLLDITRTVAADDGVKLELWASNSVEQDVRPSAHATLNVSTTSHPTSTFFGPALTTDPTNSTLTWQYQHSTAGWVAWNDATYPISSIGINASVSTDGQQAGNILDINAATTAQTVLIQCQADANYMTSGITSNQYTLVIEAAS